MMSAGIRLKRSALRDQFPEAHSLGVRAASVRSMSLRTSDHGRAAPESTS